MTFMRTLKREVMSKLLDDIESAKFSGDIYMELEIRVDLDCDVTVVTSNAHDYDIIINILEKYS